MATVHFLVLFIGNFLSLSKIFGSNLDRMMWHLSLFKHLLIIARHFSVDFEHLIVERLSWSLRALLCRIDLFDVLVEVYVVALTIQVEERIFLITLSITHLDQKHVARRLLR